MFKPCPRRLIITSPITIRLMAILTAIIRAFRCHSAGVVTGAADAATAGTAAVDIVVAGMVAVDMEVAGMAAVDMEVAGMAAAGLVAAGTVAGTDKIFVCAG